MKLSAADGSGGRVIGWQAANIATSVVPAISCKKVRRARGCCALTKVLDDILFLLKLRKAKFYSHLLAPDASPQCK
jgi:hypothetical protein